MLLQGMHHAGASFGSVAELVAPLPDTQSQASAASVTSCRCNCATGDKKLQSSPLVSVFA